MTLNGKMAIILRYCTEFGSFRAHCVKVVDRAITMDNLRLLFLVVNVCRGTARRVRYKYSITARWRFCSRIINSEMPQSYRRAQASARSPCRQCGGPRAVSQLHDFLEIGNFAPFSEFLHIKGRHFPEFFPVQVYV